MKQKLVLSFMLMCSSTALAKFSSHQSFFKDDSPLKVLVFLSENCPCSKSHVDHLNSLVRSNPEISFYGVISEPARNQEGQSKIEKYFTKERFKLPVISDPKQKLVKKYKALKTPHVTILQKGTVVYQGGLTSKKSFSGSGKKYLEENLQEISKTGQVKYKMGNSLGCYIRRLK